MEYLLTLGAAFWIGILTSISPCPLATNVAAVSFISKKIHDKKIVLLTGFLYTLGRIFAYLLLSAMILKSIYSVPMLSFFLQSQIHKILGPLLVIVGMLLLELVSLNLPSLGGIQKFQAVFKNMGVWGAFPLGAVFALSFCPVSAALFFGSLIPLAAKSSSEIILPIMYGVGTGLPVFVFAIFIAFGASWISRFFNQITLFELWVRRSMGVIFIVVGIYFSLVYIFKIF